MSANGCQLDIVNVVGGLGNQLFQWALGEALIEAGRKVAYDLSDFETYALHGGAAVERFFDLKLNDMTSASPTRLPMMARSRTRKRFAPHLISYLRPGIVTEEDVLSHGLAVQQDHDRYFLGYWQFIERSTEAQTRLREKLRFKTLQSFHDLGDLSTTAAVHVRLGDYLASPTACHLPLGRDYYRTQMRDLLDRKLTDRFLIFSDQVDRISTGWFDGLPVRFVNEAISANAGTDLQLMAQCAHLIISASSFGWWGGFLAGPGADVVYPSPWVRPAFIDRPNFTPAMPRHWRPASSVGHDLAARQR